MTEYKTFRGGFLKYMVGTQEHKWDEWVDCWQMTSSGWHTSQAKSFHESRIQRTPKGQKMYSELYFEIGLIINFFKTSSSFTWHCLTFMALTSTHLSKLQTFTFHFLLDIIPSLHSRWSLYGLPCLQSPFYLLLNILLWRHQTDTV